MDYSHYETRLLAKTTTIFPPDEENDDDFTFDSFTIDSFFNVMEIFKYSITTLKIIDVSIINNDADLFKILKNQEPQFIYESVKFITYHKLSNIQAESPRAQNLIMAKMGQILTKNARIIEPMRNKLVEFYLFTKEYPLFLNINSMDFTFFTFIDKKCEYYEYLTDETNKKFWKGRNIY